MAVGGAAAGAAGVAPGVSGSVAAGAGVAGAAGAAAAVAGWFADGTGRDCPSMITERPSAPAGAPPAGSWISNAARFKSSLVVRRRDCGAKGSRGCGGGVVPAPGTGVVGALAGVVPSLRRTTYR